ncbi:MAG: zinc-ribbon domain-containing protein [Coriobacteriales bacterium]|jgi:hypothetical protein|nr:zinc-ribbon domain-containing protein [Coriobacteriales bacterium]
MFCTKCGSKLPEKAKFCTTCGNPVEVVAEPQAVEPAAPKTANSASQGAQLAAEAVVLAQPSVSGEVITSAAAEPGVSVASAADGKVVNVAGTEPQAAKMAAAESVKAVPVQAKKKNSTTGTCVAVGFILLAAAVVVFLICNVCQGLGGSSMFSTRYTNAGDLGTSLLVNLTFYPGWIITIALVVGAIKYFIAAFMKD